MAEFNIASIFKDVPKMGPSLEQISIDALKADEKNFYIVNPESVAELAANIECVGLQQPLNVRSDPDEAGRYVVVSGHRRLAALRLLHGEGKAGFDTVPCMVVENGSEALNELRLIYGNANTRQLSGYEQAMQAERVQELFYQLKEEGFDFPGRMRDHVAEACQISKSKLSRLKVINEKLEIYAKLWESGKLAEAVAYELAQCPLELQWRFEQAKLKGEKLQAAKVKRVREAWETGARWQPSHICTPTGKECGQGDVQFRRDVHADSWNELCKGEKCCLTCRYGGECSTGQYSGPCEKMCKLAYDKRKAKKDREDAKAEAQEKKRKAKEAEELAVKLRPYVEACKAAGLEDSEKLKYEYASFTVADLKQAHEKPDEFKHKWAFNNPSSKDMMRIADQLQCSVDFLLGRTEVMAVAGTGADDICAYEKPVWQVDVPPRDGTYWCRVSFGSGPTTAARLNWEGDELGQGGLWRLTSGQHIDDEMEVTGWWPLPEV